MRDLFNDWWPDLRFSAALCGGSVLVGWLLGLFVTRLDLLERLLALAVVVMACCFAGVAYVHHKARKDREAEELERKIERDIVAKFYPEVREEDRHA
ncbi:hypothetical protein [Sutterella sp.]|uniref:hypothetical protein n=1 Tax=Sutterella sp. TaxID=1981025 RepID=UPI0026E026F6|nr:hypothetical protein [Sutterella sp.]MDO5531046.1 hypothetical protein [Sutterella sp.]